LSGAFVHHHSAHCESGVAAALARDAGQPFSEAMVFGITSALAFVFLPLVKINGLPLVAYRMPPRHILRAIRRLGVPLRFETFANPEAGMRRLDALLGEDRLVGLQACVYWLPYFPQSMRFHFNAHNLLVFGKVGESYVISDPVFERAQQCPHADLAKARFTHGLLAPKGFLYYVNGAARISPLEPLLRKAIRRTAFIMAGRVPIPFVGARAIRGFATAVERLPVEGDTQYSRRHLGHIVHMQEIIGTGGAGFRFLYAAFLQEAAAILGLPVLNEFSARLTAVGDAWREVALAAARMSKGRTPLDPTTIGTQLRTLADREQAYFRDLRQAV